MIQSYELNIRTKFSILYFNFRLNNLKKAELNKYEKEIHGFKIRFNDLRMDCYIQNFEEVYEIYFSLDDLIKYSSNLKLKCFKKVNNKDYRRNKAISFKFKGKSLY